MLIREARLRQIIRNIVLEAAEKEMYDEGDDEKVEKSKSSSKKRGSWRKDKPDPLHHLSGVKSVKSKKKSTKIDELCEDDEEEVEDESLSGEEEDEEIDDSQSEDDDETDPADLKKALKK